MASTVSSASRTNHRSNSSKPKLFSLDAWAVTLALALAALIWAGVIKHIPW